MTSRIVRGLALVAALVTFGLQPATGQESRRERGMGRGTPGQSGRRALRARPTTDSDLRTGDDAIAALRGALGDRVRARGEDPEVAARAIATDPSLAVGPEGHLVFLDAADPDDVAAAAAAAATPDPAATTAPTETVPDPDALAANGLPLHHSKPGAPWTLFIDVQSQSIPVHTFMRAMLGLRTPFVVTQGLTLDADSATFNAEEQLLVSRIWARVAEDYAPFDVDVTTERPAAFATNPWGGGRVLWNLVTRSETAIGFPAGSLYGIAAAINLCGVSGSFLGQPTFTFWGTTTPADHDLIADTVSHEAGHVLGLVHDGFMFGNSFQQYYAGHGTGPTSWGPIMGSPVKRNVTQWSAGGYPDASIGFLCGPSQDDIAHITRTFGARVDDVGDTIATATPLTLPATGVIGTTSDVDVYALPPGNQVRIDVTPFRAGELTDGGNLDVAAEIVDAAGLVVASADDVNATAATLTATLPPGPHYLRIRASFDPTSYPIYGSLGQYTITGTFTTLSRLTRVWLPDDGEIEPGRRLPVRFTLSEAVPQARVQLWSDASPLAATVLAEAPCAAQHGLRERCQLKVPRRLPRAQAYWLAIQYEAPDGTWITAEVEPGAGLTNPMRLARD
ncbi:MAG: hypothetical protein U0P30_00650 [Vicinamibacterales bacterium]